MSSKRRKDNWAKKLTSETAARIKKTPKSKEIKFKVRCQRYVYSLTLRDSEKADKLKQSLPPGTTSIVERELRAWGLTEV